MPVSPPPEKLLILTHRVMACVTELHRSALGDLTDTRFRALAVLTQAGGPVQQRVIVRTGGIDRSTVSAMINAMAADGLVTLTRDDDDARRVLVKISRQGVAAYAKACRGADRVEAALSRAAPDIRSTFADILAHGDKA